LTQQTLIDRPELYARLADCYAGLGQTGDAVHAIQADLDRLKDLEALRPLIPDEVDRRKESLAKMAAWKPSP